MKEEHHEVNICNIFVCALLTIMYIHTCTCGADIAESTSRFACANLYVPQAHLHGARHSSFSCASRSLNLNLCWIVHEYEYYEYVCADVRVCVCMRQ